MDRSCHGREVSPTCVPHRRGDGPSSGRTVVSVAVRSPQAWGWTGPARFVNSPPHAFPTGVGMDRRVRLRVRSAASVPHRRGDGPCMKPDVSAALSRSPQAWGWTVRSNMPELTLTAFPTGVGMDRSAARFLRLGRRVPHRRGDGPALPRRGWPGHKRSPQAWGWTGIGEVEGAQLLAFPTGVGMDRPSSARSTW